LKSIVPIIIIIGAIIVSIQGSHKPLMGLLGLLLAPCVLSMFFWKIANKKTAEGVIFILVYGSTVGIMILFSLAD
jgi:hypothetical protein